MTPTEGPQSQAPATSIRRAVAAGTVAAALSGVPSTAHALATGRDPLAATRAAATLVPGRAERPNVPVGIGVHLAISATWTAAFAVATRRRPMTTATGAIGGALIAVLDLGVIAPRYRQAVAALPRLPQLADHIAFGAILGRMMGAEPGTDLVTHL